MSPHQFSREGMALPQGRGDFQKVSVVCYIGLLSFLKLLKIKKGLFPSFTIMPLFITFCRIVIKMVSWRKFRALPGTAARALPCAASGATETPRTGRGFPGTPATG